MICLSYYIVPLPLIFTLMTWTWCMTYLFSHTTCSAQNNKCVKTKSTSKTRYVKRKRKGRFMHWDAKFKFSYQNKLVKELYQRQNGRHESIPTTNFTAIGLTVSHTLPTHAKLDSDSYIIAINNCCSYSMTNNKANFIGKTKPCNVNIKGIGGNNQINEYGTVCWIITDDKGKPHKIVIPGTYYNAKSPY